MPKSMLPVCHCVVGRETDHQDDVLVSSLAEPASNGNEIPVIARQKIDMNYLWESFAGRSA